VNIGAAGSQNIIQPGGLVFATDKDGLNLLQATTLSIGFPRVQMQLFFQALRENDLLRVLAEPDLVAVAGQEAKFLVGGEFPVPVPQSAGTGGVTITIEWKRFGIQLVFVATPIDRDMIRLRVAPVVSDLDFTAAVQLQGFLVPGIRERRAETTIELANGSTIAIAGLLSDSSRGAVRKVPAVGDIPVLGALFSSVQYQRDQTELVILVTPELASAMNPDQVAPVPGQYMTEPNDWQLFGLGLLEGEPEPDPDEPELAVKTDVPVRNRKWTAPPTQMSLHGPWGVADEAETR
jgi:pilus assembly protein CpaC